MWRANCNDPPKASPIEISFRNELGWSERTGRTESGCILAEHAEQDSTLAMTDHVITGKSPVLAQSLVPAFDFCSQPRIERERKIIQTPHRGVEVCNRNNKGNGCADLSRLTDGLDRSQKRWLPCLCLRINSVDQHDRRFADFEAFSGVQSAPRQLSRHGDLGAAGERYVGCSNAFEVKISGVIARCQSGNIARAPSRAIKRSNAKIGDATSLRRIERQGISAGTESTCFDDPRRHPISDETAIKLRKCVEGA